MTKPTYRDSDECFQALALELDVETEQASLTVHTVAEWAAHCFASQGIRLAEEG